MKPDKKKARAQRARDAWRKIAESVNWLSHVHDHDEHGVLEIHAALVGAEESIRGCRLFVEENLRERGVLQRGKPNLRLVKTARRRRRTKAEPGPFAKTKKRFDKLKKLTHEKIKAGRRRYDKAVMHALFEMRTRGGWDCSCEDCQFIRQKFDRTGDLCPSCGCPASEEAPKGCGAHLV